MALENAKKSNVNIATFVIQEYEGFSICFRDTAYFPLNSSIIFTKSLNR